MGFMPDIYTEAGLSRNIAAKRLQEIRRLQAKINRLQPYEIAVKKRHNGYNSEVCKELNIRPPESPEQALQDLQDEWNSMENSYVNDITKLQTEIKNLRQRIAILEEGPSINDWLQEIDQKRN